MPTPTPIAQLPLQQVSITFNTIQSRSVDTVIHVFIKNRSSDTSFSDSATDYISNHLAWSDYVNHPYSRSLYLAALENLAYGIEFADNTPSTFTLTLPPVPSSAVRWSFR